MARRRRAAADPSPAAEAAAVPVPAGASRGHRRAALALAVVAAGASAALSWGVFGAAPHVSDEVSYLFQGRVFASGRLWLEPPAVPDAFRAWHVILDASRWCGKYPPGWPLLLAPGVLLGVPWLVNPVLVALAVLGAVRLARALYGEREALVAALLLAASPFTLLTGAGFMSHPAGLAASLWALALLVEGERDGARRKLALAGLLVGLAVTVRPFTALLLLGVPIAWRVALSLRARRGVRAFAPFAAGAAVPVALLLAFQWASFGSPLRTGYSYYDPTEGLFTFLGKRYEPLALLREHLPAYLRDLSQALWDLPGPPFWWLAALLLAPRGADALLLLSAAGLVLGQSGLFWNYDLAQGGPRYVFEAVGFLSLLSARALLLLLDRLFAATSRVGLFASLASRRLGTGAALAALLVPPLLVRLPLLARSHAMSFHGTANRPLEGAAEAGLPERAVVFVSATNEVAGYDPQLDPGYHAYLNLNAPRPDDGGRVFVRDLPGRREEVLRAYPGREAWGVHLFQRPALEEESLVDQTWKLHGLAWTRLPAR